MYGVLGAFAAIMVGTAVFLHRGPGNPANPSTAQPTGASARAASAPPTDTPAAPPKATVDTGVASLFPAQPTGFVTDAAHLLGADLLASIDGRLTQLRSGTGVEVAVVTLPSIGARGPGEVARAVGRQWKVGGNVDVGDRRRNAGLVLLVVPHTSEHKGEIRIEVGQGLEGMITDLRSAEIRDAMLPSLRQGAYGTALDLAVTMVSTIVARDLGVAVPPPAPTQPRQATTPVPALDQTVDQKRTYTDAQVDGGVRQSNCLAPKYPPALRTVGVSGSVAVRYVVGIDGKIEPNSITVLNSANKAFEAPAIDAIMSCTNQAASIHGAPVRQLVEQTVRFTIGT
jgi:TonB family protein